MEALTSGKLDVCVLARPLLADPEYVNKVKRGNLQDIRTCLGCNDGCLRRASSGLQRAGCAINPRSGRERETILLPTCKPRKILVVGAGPSGMEAARVCALRGHQVELLEETNSFGGKFRFASIPSFKEEGRKLIHWYQRQLEKEGVQVTLNYKMTADDEKAKNADAIIVATGGKELIPQLPGIEKADLAIPILTGEVPAADEITIIGGGLVGCELAIHLCMNGKKVRIVEMAPAIVANARPANSVMQCVEEYLERLGVEICVNTKLCEVTDDYIIVERDGQRERIATQQTVLALGYRANSSLYDALYASIPKSIILATVGNLRTLCRALKMHLKLLLISDSKQFYSMRRLGAWIGSCAAASEEYR